MRWLLKEQMGRVLVVQVVRDSKRCFKVYRKSDNTICPGKCGDGRIALLLNFFCVWIHVCDNIGVVEDDIRDAEAIQYTLKEGNALFAAGDNYRPLNFLYSTRL